MYVYTHTHTHTDTHTPKGSAAVARVLPLTVEYAEKGTRKPGSHVVCKTDAVWARMNKMLQEN